MKTHHITVYGPGCMRCNTLAENTKQAIALLGGEITLSKETDPMKMAADGVLNTPALALDGKVLLSGKVLSAEELKDLLTEALSANEDCCCCGGDEPCCCGGGDELCCCGDKQSAQEQEPCCCGESANKPCCCGDKKTTTCSPADTTAEPARQGDCGCGGASCCGGDKGGSGLKTLLVIIVLGLLAFAGLRQLEKEQDAAPTQEQTAVPEPLANGVVLDYFTFGKRCDTCIRMETWAREAVESAFADALKDGRLIMRASDGDPATIQKYGLTAKSLVVRKIQDGKETSWQNLNRIWELNGDEAAYKAYIIEQVKQAL